MALVGHDEFGIDGRTGAVSRCLLLDLDLDGLSLSPSLQLFLHVIAVPIDDVEALGGLGHFLNRTNLGVLDDSLVTGQNLLFRNRLVDELGESEVVRRVFGDFPDGSASQTFDLVDDMI